MEQGFYVAHCCIYRIAGNLHKFHSTAAFRISFIREFYAMNEKTCGRQLAKVFRNRESI